ncbi:MAG: GNAT family N-acetyltransferase [Hyphomicrobiales bacterium]
MADGPSEIEVRRLRRADGLLLRDVRLRALADSPEAFLTTHAEAAARSEQSWHEWAERAAAGEQMVTLVAMRDQACVGMAGGFVHDDEPDVPELIQVWVAPEGRGTGAGAGLVAAVVGWANERGAEAVQLWVAEGNAHAIGLYRRMGFEVDGERVHPPTGQRLLRMTLPCRAAS